MKRTSATGRHIAVPGLLSVAAVSAATLVAACGTANQGQGTPSTTPPSAPTTAASTAPASPSPSTSASPATATATCTPTQLKVSVDVAQSSGAAGSIYYPIDFANISASTCTLYGYPGVSFVTSPSGSQIGQPASRNPTSPATTVTLAPGSSAHATLQVAEAGNYTPSVCSPVTAHWLRVYPPGSLTAAYAQFTTQVCAGNLPAKIGRQLSVMVVLPGAGKAGQP